MAKNVCKSRRLSLGSDSKSLKVLISSLCTTDRNVRLLPLFEGSHFLERWLSLVGIPIKARERPRLYGEDEGLGLFSSVVVYVDQFQSRHFPFLAVLSAEQVGEFHRFRHSRFMFCIPCSSSSRSGPFLVPCANWKALTTRPTVLAMYQTVSILHHDNMFDNCRSKVQNFTHEWS